MVVIFIYLGVWVIEWKIYLRLLLTAFSNISLLCSCTQWHSQVIHSQCPSAAWAHCVSENSVQSVEVAGGGGGGGGLGACSPTAFYHCPVFDCLQYAKMKAMKALLLPEE